MTQEVLGVDIGGVIINHAKVHGVYPPLPNVFEVLKKLGEERFGDRIFVVSHADLHMSGKMLEWLWDKHFFDITGIAIGNVHFCHRRIGKVEICLRFGITHFIDDRREILTYLHSAEIKNLYLFQERKEEANSYMDILPNVIRVASWGEVAKQLLE